MSSETASVPPGVGRQRVGRPRANPSSRGLAPRDEILAAATHLFTERGIGEVTMAEIAAHVGLRQASLYYWFRRREDILAEIVEQVNRIPLELVIMIEEEAEDPAVLLWRLVQYDIGALCAFPLDINEVHRLTRRAPDAFHVYLRERQALTDAAEGLIVRGVDTGVFRPVDPRLAALVVVSNNEGVQNWQRSGDGRGLTGRPDGGYRVDELAAFVGELTLGGLLVSPADLEWIRLAATPR